MEVFFYQDIKELKKQFTEYLSTLPPKTKKDIIKTQK